MKHTPHAMNDLLSLEEVPNVGDDEQNKKRVALAEQGPLPGESLCRWCVLDMGSSSSSAKPVPLPDWMKIPLDRTVAIWTQEKTEWDRKKQVRFETKGTYELTKKTKAKYQDNGCRYMYMFVFPNVCFV